jgi:transposase
VRADYPDEAVFFEDELRAGTRTELSRKWTPMGHRPLAPVRIGYEFTYLYLAVCPFTGQGYAAFLPALDKVHFGWFADRIAEATAGPTLLVVDGASAHRVDSPEALRVVTLPAACPELNPVERFFKAVRQRLKCRVFGCLAQAKKAVQDAVEWVSETADKTISLTCFPYIKNTSVQN